MFSRDRPMGCTYVFCQALLASKVSKPSPRHACMSTIDTDTSFSDRLKVLEQVLGAPPRETFEFRELEWKGGCLFANGTSGPASFRVILNIQPPAGEVFSKCSICGSGKFCPHARSLIHLVNENGIAADIDSRGLASCHYSLKRRNKKPTNAWKSQFTNFARQFEYYSPPAPQRSSFPAGREAIYVLQQHPGYTRSNDAIEIIVATRPIVPPQRPAASKPKYANSIYRNFAAGVAALAASSDPLDRDIAEKLSLTSAAYGYYESRQQVRMSMSPQTSAGLLARLAQSNRLFWNAEYSLHDGMLPLGWLGDDKFDLKFEIAAADGENLSLGLCAVAGATVLSQQDLKAIASCFLIDGQNRLGLFRQTAPPQLLGAFAARKPIVVPRKDAPELIEKVMNVPLGLGIEFTGCDDIRPARATCSPKPLIHIKAPQQFQSDALEAKVRFDYDGVMIPLEKRVREFYDKQRGVIVPVDTGFHDRCSDLLHSLGVKMTSYDYSRLTFAKKKLPKIVAHLIHEGWHVEADGKLYRNGSRFDLNVVSGIDWFELQGKAHFDQTSIDLPRLLHALRSGEKTVVLDDGSIGLIPEAWLKQFSGIAELASADDGSLKFGNAQVGLLGALLAEQGAVNVDEKFAAARESLRRFDRIASQEPPVGFVGALRPYQKLAQGWFEFLRKLGFGGCLADDMGLGKTIQVLSLLEHRRQLKSGPSLIVVPRSLIFNWIAEAAKFTPNLRVLDQSHSQRIRGTEHLTDFDLVLTTYGTLRRDAAFLKDFEVDYVVLDEAQAIKNATTEASKAARLLRGRHKLALSGTPIENHLGELWSLFDFLNTGMLGHVGRFTNLADDADGDQRKLLAAVVRPFILRRTKKQVAPELPDRVEQTVIVELDADQRKAYDELRDYYRQMLTNKIETDGIGKSQFVILEALLRLRQAACHPGLIDKAMVTKPSAKLGELLNRLRTAREAGERVLVFSQFTSFLAIVKQRLKQERIQFLYLDGKTKDRQALVNQFQSGDGPAVFLISLKAGGVGLNLTAARTVYLLDPWWNPAVEAQAIDRSHRIGQRQAVFATRLIAADTVEQKVLELQAKKKGLADAIVNADNAGISSLTREDLELLLA
jgi:hypothetical protein